MIASYSDLDVLFLGSRDTASELLHLEPRGTAKTIGNDRGGLEALSHRVNSAEGSGHESPPAQKAKDCPNAQKRFRARQKERLSCLEREVAEKRATFDHLAAENQQLKARTHILEKVVSCRDEQLGMVQAFAEHCHTPPHARSCFGRGMITVPTDSQEEMFRSMTKEQIVPEYKAFLSEVSRHLLHCQYPCSDPTNPIVQKVTACVERMGHTMKHVMLLNEALLRQLLSLNLETLQPASAADAHWDDVVASLQLGPDQRSDILAVFDLYRSLVAKVYEERKLITATLGDGCGTLDPGAESFLGRNTMAGEMELVERLDANLGKEHSAHTLLCCFFFGKVLAPPQFAKVAVYSYPFFPDSLAVASAVARQINGSARSGGSGSAAGSHESGRYSH